MVISPLIGLAVRNLAFFHLSGKAKILRRCKRLESDIDLVEK